MRAPYRTIPIARAVAALDRDFLLQELRLDAGANAPRAVVAVQAAPKADDTPWLLDFAEHEPAVPAVVGWVDLGTRGAGRRDRQQG